MAGGRCRSKNASAHGSARFMQLPAVVCPRAVRAPMQMNESIDDAVTPLQQRGGCAARG